MGGSATNVAEAIMGGVANKKDSLQKTARVERTKFIWGGA